MNRPLRIALIASARFPIREPFAGGLEAHTWALAWSLKQLGHQVTLFAAPGSDPALGVRELPVQTLQLSPAARSDVSMPDASWMAEQHAYLRLMLQLGPGSGFDLIHNNSLHHLPIALSATLDVPLITTLHTPPTAWMESAIQACDPCPVVFTAVSAHTARAWRPLVPDAQVLHNGIDTALWTEGPGGSDLAWSGRLVPEKGAHLAIAAARKAGYRLRLAGPVVDRRYFRECIVPQLGDGIDYVGHLHRRALARMIGRCAAVLVTPCWDEPYGLVVAEALACGTPVCGFDRGALSEILTPDCGRLVPAGDEARLADAIAPTTALGRGAARERAEHFCSLRAMSRRYEALYQELAA
ncbi:glycosyltransferase family 4 protein [Streptacidiphilus sp. PB12-B1b]|uniref:glycosyltransferase n=1 Tax=Streptacidiphilus sp. PB12-B1b TaxID=2705012 RepID=UPI0015FBDA02|nr:glycosyltransferase [Streptacidiphilus sp. PB12-B1b]QMU76836.1 glycosyltransferase family 4 protein [Streptacidiphilus sp. PB12-B1b]